MAGLDLFHAFQTQAILNEIPAGKMVIGVSGGADSVALLHILHRLARKKKWSLAAGHVQHQLRGKESQRDQIFVESLCRRLRIPCEVRNMPVRAYASANKLGIEQAARILRYRALSDIAGQVGAGAIFTAHNADDQAETVLLHLIRGSGMDGLCGIWPVRTLDRITGQKSDAHLLTVRPLLSFGRAEILAYLQSQKLRFREDRSNRSVEYRRNWVRHRLIPLLRQVQPKIGQKISTLSTIFQQEKRWLDLRLEAMQDKFLASGGAKLDLVSFFRYDIYLRLQWLHGLFPRGSYEEIGRIEALLQKRKSQSRWFLVSELGSLIRSRNISAA